jgi:hypothetical protein
MAALNGLEIGSVLEIGALGVALGLLLGFCSVVLIRWFTPHLRKQLPRRPKSAVCCLMCGKSNRITPQEREQALVICRCGQPLFLPGTLHRLPSRRKRHGMQPS